MLQEITRDLEFEHFHISHLIDDRRRFQLDLDPRFPLKITSYRFPPYTQITRMNWHERLELFVPVAGQGRFRMGGRLVPFIAGDVLVVDNLKLRGIQEFYGGDRLGVVITFLPELICSPASFPCDSAYLLPFFCKPPDADPVLHTSDRVSADVQRAVTGLIQCYTGESAGSGAREAGCKAHLLLILYHLTAHFRLDPMTVSEYDSRRRQSLQFGRLYDHLRENLAEPLSVAGAAAIAGMNEFRFMKFFKKATGMTFVAFLTQLRLSKAHRLLTETDRSVAGIAAEVGFSDQSYFDRRFRQMYGTTPRKVRMPAG
jgi:AraC-like DNA-binding protein